MPERPYRSRSGRGAHPLALALRGLTPAAGLSLALTAVVIVSLLVAAGPAGSARASSKNGKFAYADGGSIWVMNASGSGRKVLTPHSRVATTQRLDSEPDWSPDGREIAFTRSRQTTGLHGSAEPVSEIDVMNADGSSQTRLTRTAMNDHSPAWSPDGKRIAFVRDRIIRRGGQAMANTGEIYAMKANGSGQTRLTHVAIAACEKSSNIDASQPAWSPDGTKIAFTSVAADYPCNHEIHVMNADGSGQKQLTGKGGPNDAGNASDPAWSPDGKKIAFQSQAAGLARDEKLEIYVMNADGSGQTPLTKNDGFCPYRCPNGEIHDQPVWSPDGKKIAFKREIHAKTIHQEDLSDLFVMNADSSGSRLVQGQIRDVVDWGPVPSGAPNPLPAPPPVLLGHPTLTVRCMRGDLHFLVGPPAGIDFVHFNFNGIDLGQSGQAPFGTSYPGDRLPRGTWVVKAVVSVETESSVAELVLTKRQKRHAAHC